MRSLRTPCSRSRSSMRSAMARIWMLDLPVQIRKKSVTIVSSRRSSATMSLARTESAAAAIRRTRSSESSDSPATRGAPVAWVWGASCVSLLTLTVLGAGTVSIQTMPLDVVQDLVWSEVADRQAGGDTLADVGGRDAQRGRAEQQDACPVIIRQGGHPLHRVEARTRRGDEGRHLDDLLGPVPGQDLRDGVHACDIV